MFKKDNHLPPLLYQGSVKNLREHLENDKVLFEYSDRYSVFDWGEMPDLLNDKGTSLAVTTDLLFKLLGDKYTWSRFDKEEDKISDKVKSYLQKSKLLPSLQDSGLKHHSLGLSDDKVRSLEFQSTSNFLQVEKVNIHRPTVTTKDGKESLDYSIYKKRPQNSLVPLEIIFRFGIPMGSSLVKRTQKNPDYIKTLGLNKLPEFGDEYELPLIEFTTKLESTDRFLSLSEAQEISGMSESELKHLTELAILSSLQLRSIFKGVGTKLWDGKLEFAFAENVSENHPYPGRNFKLVDAIGPDELRLTYKDIPLSKELLRQNYKNSKWTENVAKAKKMAKEKGVQDWKSICIQELHSRPDRLPEEIKTYTENLYKSLTNRLSSYYFSFTAFSNTPDLDELNEKYLSLKESNK